MASKVLLVLTPNHCTAQLLNIPLLPTKYNSYLHEVITVFSCFIIIVFYIQRYITIKNREMGNIILLTALSFFKAERK